MKPTEYFSNLNTSVFPEKAEKYLKDEILSDTDISSLREDDKDFMEIQKIVEEKYPTALVIEPVKEVEGNKEPEKLTKKVYTKKIKDMRVLLSLTTEKEKKKQIRIIIEGYKTLKELSE